MQTELFGTAHTGEPVNYIDGLGIPYMGSKRAIALKIVRVLHHLKPQAEYFYDLFGGGGSITAAAVQFGYKVIYNEYNTAICNLFKRCCDKTPFPKKWYEWVSREQFFECLKHDDEYSAMVKSVYSFGNNGQDYLFNKDIENTKRLMHECVVNEDEDACRQLQKQLNIPLIIYHGGTVKQRRLAFMSQVKRFTKEHWRLEQLERLEQLQQLQQLQQLEQIYNLSYEQVPITTPPEKTIIYLDPPYRGTEKYSNGGFDHNALDEWFRNCPYSCYMSEYTAPHKEVWRVQKRGLLCKQERSSGQLKTERLYWNGK